MKSLDGLFKRSIGKNFLLNLFANGVMVVAMQIFVYPQIAQVCSAEVYGSFLTIIGFFLLVGETFGNSLNNVRLIVNEKYHNAQVEGDFNWLLAVSLLFEALLSVFLFQFLPGEYSSFGIVGIFLLFLLVIVEQYYSVAFRLELNYLKILLMNVIFSLTYILSTVWYVYCNSNVNNWFVIFLAGEIATLFISARILICGGRLLLKQSFLRIQRLII